MDKVRKRLSSVGQFKDGMTNAGLEMVELITTPGPGKKLATENSGHFATSPLVLQRSFA